MYALSPVHTGDKVDRIGDNVDRDKLSNSSCCRFVAKTGNKVDRIGDSRLCFRFVAGFGNNRLCRQCVLGFTDTSIQRHFGTRTEVSWYRMYRYGASEPS